MTDSHRINLALVPTALRNAGYEPPTYRRVYRAALDGRLPGAEHNGGRWRVPVSALPTIAAALGLALRKRDVAAPSPQREGPPPRAAA